MFLEIPAKARSTNQTAFQRFLSSARTWTVHKSIEGDFQGFLKGFVDFDGHPALSARCSTSRSLTTFDGEDCHCSCSVLYRRIVSGTESVQDCKVPTMHTEIIFIASWYAMSSAALTHLSPPCVVRTCRLGLSSNVSLQKCLLRGASLSRLISALLWRNRRLRCTTFPS